MEYEIDNESKYTTLHIRATLVWKDMSKKVKNWHRCKSPQGGWWIGSKEPIRKDLFLLLAVIYNIIKLKLMQFGHYYLGSKGLQQACNKLELNKMVGEAFGKLWFVQELENGQSILIFFVRPNKKKQSIRIKCVQTHFKSVLGYHTSYRKKN